MKEQLATLRERCSFVFAIVRRAREYATRVKPVFAEESLVGLVEEARAQLFERLGARAETLVFTNDVDPELRAEVDRHALLQALQNLLQNAAEAYDVGAARMTVRVTSRMRRAASEVELCVADEGKGMREDRIPSLFIPFGSRKPGGTGVGLLIVRREVEEVHGGALEIASVPGKGTTMTMVLPVKQRP
jgi:signal transduction histidine kinase